MRLGTPPPEDMPREFWAAWYWDEIQNAAAEHSDHISPATECIAIQDLITGAIEAGVIGNCIPVAGYAKPQTLAYLVAPYRTREGGAAQREEAERRRVLDRPVPKRFRWGDPA